MKGSEHDDSILPPRGLQSCGTGPRDVVRGDDGYLHLFSHHVGQRLPAATARAVD
jgi:hypothetical protein